MSDQTVTLRIVGESGQLVAAVRTSKTELAGLGAQARDTGTQAATGARQVRSIGEASQQSDRQVAALRGQLGGLKAMLAGVVGVQTIRQLGGMADGYSDIIGKLKQVSNGERELQQAKADTFRIAQSTYQQLDATVTLYSRAYGALKQYNVGQQQVAELTETVNRGLLVSRATTAESASAILQLSQAMGAGALRGEEFNAVNEAAPRLMQLLADSMGRPRGELKKLAEDGKLTVDVLLKALTGPLAKQLEAEAALVPLTIGRAWTQMKNEALKAIGEVDQAQGASAAVAAAIGGLAQHINLLITLGGVLAVVYGGKVLGALISSTAAVVKKTVATAAGAVMERRNAAAAVVTAQAQVRAAMATGMSTQASNALTAAQARLVAASAASSAAFARLGAGMLAFVGGPVGAILIALGLVVGKLMAVKASADAARGSVGDLVDNAAYARDTLDRKALNQSNAELKASREQLIKDRNGLRTLINDPLGAVHTTRRDGESMFASRAELRRRLERTERDLKVVDGQLESNWNKIWGNVLDVGRPSKEPELNIPTTISGGKTPKPAKANDDAQQRLDEMKRWREEAQRAAAVMEGPLKEAEVKRDQRLSELAESLGKGRIEQAAYNTLVSDAKRVFEEEAEAARAANEEFKRRQSAPEKLLNDMERERHMIGLVGRERELANEQLRAQEELERAIADALDAKRRFTEREIEDLKREADARAEAIVLAREQAELAAGYREKWTSAIGSVADAWGQWFASGFRDTKDFLAQTLDAFKRWLSDLVAMFARAQLGKWLQVDLGAGTGGFNWGSLLGGQGNGGGGNWMQSLQRMYGSYQQARAGGGGFWQSVFSAGTSGFGGGGSGFGSYAQYAQYLPAMYSAVFGGGAAAAGAGTFGTLGAIGGAGTFGTGVGGAYAVGSAGASTGAAGAAAGAGTAAAAATGVLAILAGMYLNSQWYKQGWDVEGQQSDILKESFKFSVKSGFGPAFTDQLAVMTADKLLRSMGVNGKWATILSGSAIAARAWGHRKPQVQATGIMGSYGFDGIDGQEYADWKAKGGWFRSDKHGTTTDAMSNELNQLFAMIGEQQKTVANEMAQAIGINIESALAAVSFDLGKRELKGTEEEKQKQLEEILQEVTRKLSEATVDALGFGSLLQSTGAPAAEVLAALGVSIALVTGGAEKLGRALNTLEKEDIAKATQWFADSARKNGTDLMSEVNRVSGLLNDYSGMVSGVDSQLRTAGLNEYQRAQLQIETQYRQQVKQANELAKALGLSGARSEDLAKFEQLRAMSMANLQKQMDDAKNTWLNDLSLSELSPFTDAQKRQQAWSDMQGAAAKGDLQRAQQLGETVLQLSRRLDASGADYNGWYDRVRGVVNGIDMPATTMQDGTTMGELADILLDLPGRIAHELFGVVAQLSYAQAGNPVITPAPTPSPAPPNGGGTGGGGGGRGDTGEHYMPGKPDRGREMVQLLQQLVDQGGAIMRSDALRTLEAIQ